MKTKVVPPWIQEEIILAKPYQGHDVLESIAIYKSLLPQFSKDSMIFSKDDVIMIFPLTSFVYNCCEKNKKDRLHFYKHEPISVKAKIASDVKMRKHVSEYDPCSLNHLADLAILYDEDICKSIMESAATPDECVPQELIIQPIKFYIVIAKGGHVGKHRYYPIQLPIQASSVSEAVQIAIQLPRVKHKNSSDVIEIYEVDEAKYMEQVCENRNNPYHSFKDKYEAKSWIQQHRNEFVKDLLG
jgi:hypothetical protein